ncbi:glycosyltransferase family 4 protein [Achromobacter denitrificans]
MKIVHLCVSCFYIDGYRYQENELIAEHVRQGHDVTVIASTETFVDNMNLGYVEPSTYMGQDGAKVIRLAYSGPLPARVQQKLRMHKGIYQLLDEIKPDVIMFHGLCGWELLTAARYKKRNPSTIFYVDSHEDAHNSARSFFSKNVLHGIYYKSIIKASLPQIEKVLCISLETMDFCRKQYGISEDKLEFFPLGGKLAREPYYSETRERVRRQYEIADDEILFVQSGKFDWKRKMLVESLKAFAKTSDSKLRFFIAGIVSDALKPEVEQLVAADPRVQFLGWKTAEDLYELLCAADVYVQPGTQSATMQISLCARCAVLLDDVPSHVPFVYGNGWKVHDINGLEEVFLSIENDKGQVAAMRGRSYAIAEKLLDYERMAQRLLQLR